MLISTPNATLPFPAEDTAEMIFDTLEVKIKQRVRSGGGGGMGECYIERYFPIGECAVFVAQKLNANCFSSAISAARAAVNIGDVVVGNNKIRIRIENYSSGLTYQQKIKYLSKK